MNVSSVVECSGGKEREAHCSFVMHQLCHAPIQRSCLFATKQQAIASGATVAMVGEPSFCLGVNGVCGIDKEQVEKYGFFLHVHYFGHILKRKL